MSGGGFGDQTYPGCALSHGDSQEDLQHFEMRLLKLTPNTDKDGIMRCRLITQGLNHDQSLLEHPFTALSYCWGTDISSNIIDVEGKSYKPTANLYNALINIASSISEEILLWIDAICINQNDAFEKEKQISIMAQIYSLAQETIIWFSSDDDACSEAFELLPQISSLSQVILQSSVPFFNIDQNMSVKEQIRISLERFFALVYFEENHQHSLNSRQNGLNILNRIAVGTGNTEEYFSYGKRLVYTELAFGEKPTIVRNDLSDVFCEGSDRERAAEKVLQRYGLPKRKDKSWEVIRSTLKQPWLERIWVVQELVVSRNPVVMYRRRKVSWDDYITALHFINGLQNEPAQHKGIRALILEKQRNEYQSSVRSDLLEVVRRYRRWLATLPQDKIYGIQGISSGRLQYSYTSSPDQLYTDFAFSTISKSSSLDILQDVSCNHKTNKTLPSWVPDWSNREGILTDITSGTAIFRPGSVKQNSKGDSRTEFDAACGTKCAPKRSKDGQCLILSACFVSKVSEVEPSSTVIWKEFKKKETKDSKPNERGSAQSQAFDTAFRWYALATSSSSSLVQLFHFFTQSRTTTERQLYFTGETQVQALLYTLYSAYPPHDKITDGHMEIKARAMSFLLPMGRLFQTPLHFFTRCLAPEVPSIIKFSVFCWIFSSVLATFTGLMVTYVVIHWTAFFLDMPIFFAQFLAFRLFGILLVDGFVIQSWLVSKEKIWADFIGLEGWPNMPIWSRINEAQNFHHEGLARSENGLLALVPCTTKVGDEIVIFQGGKTPFVIRQIDQGWKLIGRCYVHGIMYGAAFRPDICTEIELV